MMVAHPLRKKAKTTRITKPTEIASVR